MISRKTKFEKKNWFKSLSTKLINFAYAILFQLPMFNIFVFLNFYIFYSSIHLERVIKIQCKI